MRELRQKNSSREHKLGAAATLRLLKGQLRLEATCLPWARVPAPSSLAAVDSVGHNIDPSSQNEHLLTHTPSSYPSGRNPQG